MAVVINYSKKNSVIIVYYFLKQA